MSDAPQPPTAGCRIRDPGPTDGIGPPTCNELYAQLRTVDDPILGDDIVSLGLVDDVSVDCELIVVEMGLYAPYAPNERQIVEDVHDALRFFNRKVVTAVGENGRMRSRTGGLAGVRNVVPIVGVGDAADDSTVATNVAFALSRIGARVGVLELDADRIGSDETVGRVATAATTSGVPATVHGVSVAMARTVEHAVTGIDWGGLDYLFVDVPADRDGTLETLFDRFPTVNPVVTIDRSASMTDVRNRLDRLTEWGITPLGAIETTGGPIREERRSRFGHTVGNGITEEVELSTFGRIPDTAAIGSGRETSIVWAGHELSTVFDSIASGIANAVGAMGRRAHAERTRGLGSGPR